MAHDIAHVIDRITVHVDDDCMILRMWTKKRDDHFNAVEFVDRFAGNVERTDVYEAQAIIDHRDLDKAGIQTRGYLVNRMGFDKKSDNKWPIGSVPRTNDFSEDQAIFEKEIKKAHIYLHEQAQQRVVSDKKVM